MRSKDTRYIYIYVGKTFSLSVHKNYVTTFNLRFSRCAHQI